MNLITQEWRLKLLALGLAILMLGAVAFSQSNTRTLQVNISYVNRPDGLILIAPLDRIAVSVSAPNDLPLTPASVTATADLSHIKKGLVSVPIQVRPTDLRIVVQSPPPITVSADTYLNNPPLTLPIQVRTPNVTPGWAVVTAVARCPGASTSLPCPVQFSGPASLAVGLDAFVTVDAPILGQTVESLNLPVQFEQNGRPIDMTKLETLPQITVQPSTVNIYIQAKQGTASVQVTLLDAAPTHYPPQGYRVTNVTVTPLTVVCTGPAGPAIANMAPITLPGVDLSHSTSNVTFKVQVPTTTAGVTCSPSVANVTYAISANPNTQPSPTPT